jgi:hypothetical protein
MDFFKFWMPQVNNSVESAKYQADNEKHELAHKFLDGAEQALERAREQTLEEIEARDTDHLMRNS